ncbi:MAG: branched-chain amino acid transporter AzlD [Clostridiales bacterium]|jgi:branched-subunit amino acid transport protein AzlD|nr:branched-chain amino acid transporter AzlD [Clostridiales bacterium]
MTLTPVQTLIIIGAVTLGTAVTRFLPFVIFKKAASERSYIGYLGRVLPYAAIGLLVVYCLKGVSFADTPHGIPEAIAVVVTAALHYWKDNVLLSIGAGTVVYMALVNIVFI